MLAVHDISFDQSASALFTRMGAPLAEIVWPTEPVQAGFWLDNKFWFTVSVADRVQSSLKKVLRGLDLNDEERVAALAATSAAVNMIRETAISKEPLASINDDAVVVMTWRSNGEAPVIMSCSWDGHVTYSFGDGRLREFETTSSLPDELRTRLQD